MINLEIRNLKTNIIHLLNKSELPIEVKRLVMSEIYRELYETAEQVIRGELVAQQEQKDKEEANVNE